MSAYVDRLPLAPGLDLDDLLGRVGRALGGVGQRIGQVFMSPGFSDAEELVVLDSIFGDGSTNLNTAPTFLALTTVAVTETMTGATITEATYTGYARKSLAAADLPAASAGEKHNSVAQTFADCTAGSSTVIGWAVCTTTGTGTGTVIVFGTCTSTVISTTQTPPTVAISGLSVTLD